MYEDISLNMYKGLHRSYSIILLKANFYILNKFIRTFAVSLTVHKDSYLCACMCTLIYGCNEDETRLIARNTGYFVFSKLLKIYFPESQNQ